MYLRVGAEHKSPLNSRYLNISHFDHWNAVLVSGIERVLAGREPVDRARSRSRSPVPLAAAALLPLVASGASTAAVAAVLLGINSIELLKIFLKIFLRF